MIAWVCPDATVRSTPFRISLGPSSVATETCRSLISKVDMCAFSVVVAWSDGEDGELGLDGRLQPFPQLGQGDLGQDLAEEAAHDRAACDVLGDSATLQVEELLVVEPAGGAGVACTGDLAGLDLQVGHRVGAGLLGEHQVAVELEGLGAFRGRPDQ